MSNFISKIFGGVLDAVNASDEKMISKEYTQAQTDATKMENHFMKGKDARISYVQMLQLVQLLMKPYADQKDDGIRFTENIYQAIGEMPPFEELLAKVLQCEERDVEHWAKEVWEADGNAFFALDALLLWYQMNAGDRGLQALTEFFCVLSMNQDLVTEAAQAAKMIRAKDVKGFFAADWNLLTPEILKQYFAGENSMEQELLKKASSLFIRDHTTDAYPYFENLAKIGNARALYFMGEYYRQGLAGLKKNQELEFSYYREGAKRGDLLCAVMSAFEPDADLEKVLTETVPKLLSSAQAKDIVTQTKLGYILEENMSCFTEGNPLAEMGFDNVRQLRQFIESNRIKAAEKGYWLAILRLAEKDENGEWNAGSVEKAVKGLEKLYKEKGDHIKEAFRRIVRLYEEEKCENKAENWYARGIRDGYDWALCIQAEKYIQGDKYFELENWDQSMALYKKAYEMYGESAGWAACGIGSAYNQKEELDNAFIWYKKSAEEGYDEGIISVGWCYQNGKGVEKNIDTAMEWYLKAYDLHGEHADQAAIRIGYLYTYELKDYKNAIEWYQRAIELGNASGASSIGHLYEEIKDYGKAIEWYQRAIELGYAYGAREIGDLYKGIKDYGKAIEWYQRATELGDAFCAWYIGQIYADELKDYKKAIEWYQREIELGDPYGATAIASLYRYGKGVDENFLKAIEWYQKAFEMRESTDVESDIGDMYKELKEYGKAIEWYRKSYNKFYNRASKTWKAGFDAFYIGDIYAKLKDYKEAIEWLRKSYEIKPDGDVANNLGAYYVELKDYKEAIEWFRRGAELGCDCAARNLGVIYEYGKWVPKDLSQAMYWYRKAYEIHGNYEGEAANGIRRLGGSV